MFGEPFDYYDEEETKPSGDDIVTPALKELERKQEIYNQLYNYIEYYGVDSKEVNNLYMIYGLKDKRYIKLFDNIKEAINTCQGVSK